MEVGPSSRTTCTLAVLSRASEAGPIRVVETSLCSLCSLCLCLPCLCLPCLCLVCLRLVCSSFCPMSALMTSKVRGRCLDFGPSSALPTACSAGASSSRLCSLGASSSRLCSFPCLRSLSPLVTRLRRRLRRGGPTITRAGETGPSVVAATLVSGAAGSAFSAMVDAGPVIVGSTLPLPKDGGPRIFAGAKGADGTTFTPLGAIPTLVRALLRRMHITTKIIIPAKIKTATIDAITMTAVFDSSPSLPGPPLRALDALGSRDEVVMPSSVRT